MGGKKAGTGIRESEIVDPEDQNLGFRYKSRFMGPI